MGKIKLILGASILLVSMQVNAALFSRLSGQAVYDDVLNITWLADANLAASNSFGVSGISSLEPGRMSWFTAEDWFAAMNTAAYLGYNGWRLPTMLDTGNPGCDRANFGTDCGYNVQTYESGTGVIFSEMAYMYYENFDAIGAFNPDGSLNPITVYGVDGATNSANLALFTNIMNERYMYGLEVVNNTSSAWSMSYAIGEQDPTGKGGADFAWAVHDGDIGCSEFPGGGATGGCFPGKVPAPAAIWLFGTGLLGLVGFSKRRKAA